ncbi:hypothetical protein VB796_13365 [Arcicella sp. LKC2W]|uniref:hypothetical protein n=1 Tax=Arcicella sp. LKC2W TaxID=2984198 RepID=UPI002B1FF305|nr:hypothetical protein [Arcicella sp. LKC2W]MEA5460039.1 hypothetical protein [Arcicella sp. LKC2W]
MDDFYKNNPQWLQQNIIDDTFLWEKSFTTTFDEFLNYVTFHDSFWIGSFINQDMEYVCIIRLDAFWNQKYSQSEKYDNEWHFCLVKIKNIISFRIKKLDNDQTNTIGNCTTEIIDSTSITQFDDVYGGHIEFTHKPQIKVLLITEQGEYLNPNPIICNEK